MIDWLNVLYNALWILALAIALAVVSWSSWLASTTASSLRSELEETSPQRGLMLAGLLFTLGLGLTTSVWYQKGLWFMLTAYFLVQLVRLFGQKASPKA